MDSSTVATFEAGRDRLASLAYRLLGSAADAEDTVQDAFLRWQVADREHIEVPEAWLTKVVTNLALDRLRSARTRRERAAGAWLPEPLLDGDPMLGPADTVEQRESVTLAVLLLLEQLSPVERAAYVLREAFAYRHSEIAEILGITESASQQHTSRARRRVAAGRQRGDTGVDEATARRIVGAFVAAASSGRTEQLVALLTDDAAGVSDGAGFGPAKKLVRFAGRQRITRAIRSAFTPSPAKRAFVGGSPEVHAAVVNGCPAILFALGDQVFGAVVLEVRGEQVAGFHGVATPERLARLTEAWQRQGPAEPLTQLW